MELLLDTNILLFMAFAPERLNAEVTGYLEDTENILCFSAASIWEVVIKRALNKPDFSINPAELRNGLFAAGLMEIAVKSDHALLVADLPEKLHKDPFDRLLVATAKNGKMPLVTNDSKLIDSADGYITIVSNR